MIEQIKTLFSKIAQKPAPAIDGRTDEAAGAAPPAKLSSSTSDLLHLPLKHKQTVMKALSTLASGKPIDDKELLLEKSVNLLQTLPPNSGLEKKLSNGLIDLLYNDLPHPPPSAAGPSSKYRKHDGSGNNIWVPDLGKAGSSYSRSVPPSRHADADLPNPEDVFDLLMKREGDFRPHPSGLNRLFFSFATIVIHECFQTSRKNPWINETSSYLDLSTLYGNTKNEQSRIRTYENGQIFADSIASERIMMMPPGVVAVLLLFSRNHNQIAKDLLYVNENGRYKDWDSLDDEQRKWQDEDIFQISRNINVGFFVSVVLKDYVAAILNTPRANSTWNLDIGAEIKKNNKRVERGAGNATSVEFAVLYHWHAALSASDDQWFADFVTETLPELKSINDLTPEMLEKVMKVHGHKLRETEPKDWTFGKLKRGSDGRFDDIELSELIKDCIEEPAHAFGAHGSPASMKIIEVMAQIQARDVFQVCTMNEFRRYLHLKPYESFEEWNPDKGTAKAAELLYGHIENLELYPGLMAECTKPAVAGSGICTGQTTGRGILNDAISLVRCDRYLSYDFNHTTLTKWGVAKLEDAHPGAFGGILPNILFGALRYRFTGTSSYALLPFYTPEAAKEILADNNVIDKYDTKRPPIGMPVAGIHTQEACKGVAEDRESFHTMYQNAIINCTGGYEFMIGWENAEKHNARSKILHEAYFEEGFEDNCNKFFREHTARLIQEHSLKIPSASKRIIDIVRDVTNVVPVLWLADRFAIPLKTKECPHGLLTIEEAFVAFQVLFMYQSFNVLPENEWIFREVGTKAGKTLRSIFEAHLRTQMGVKGKLVDWFSKGTSYEVGPHAQRLYRKLLESGLPVGEIAGDCIGISNPVVGNLAQQASMLIELFLSEGYEEYKERIIELSHREDAEAERELQGFVYEGIRHAAVVPGSPRVATKDITVMDGARGPIHLKQGQHFLIASSRSSMDPIAFPEPEKLNPHRPFRDYSILGHGLHYCFGARLAGCTLAATLREVFKLNNIRRALGKKGKFTFVEYDVGGVTMRKYLDGNSKEMPIPTTFSLEYDED